MSDSIKAALDAAQMHAVGNDGKPIPADPIIAAFLDALRDAADGGHTDLPGGCIWTGEFSSLAAAVRRAGGAA